MRNVKNKALYKTIITITLPIMVQLLLDSAVNMADVVMVNAVENGQQYMAGVNVAAKASNIIFMFLFGVGSGMTMMGAQYWGKKDVRSIEKAQGIALRFNLYISVITTAACLIIPEPMMRIFTDDPEYIMYGVQYLRIFAGCIFVWGISAVYLAALRSTGRVAICTAVEMMALLINVALNAVFLFAFKLGVRGVAMATVISRVTELIVCIVISKRSHTIKLRIKDVFEWHPALEKDFLRMCLPAIANDLVWGLGYAAYTAIIGHIPERGSDAIAALAIVETVRNLACTMCYGLGGATAIILGQILGENRFDDAMSAGKVLLRWSAIAGAAGGGLIALTIPVYCPLANLNDAAREYLYFMMWVNVVYIMGTAVNSTLIAGAFRAGGNTLFGFLCDLIDMWAWGVPVGLLAAYVFKLDPKWVYLILCTDEFVKWPWVFKHFYSGKWARNITRDDIDSVKSVPAQ
ncbi:MAG: MATE family efflux transporter [Clostridiales bacterium]|nr:MATE family efflux transporter [Clostridiales bacterium]